MDAVKGYKAERDIPLSPEDTHQTGMIGEEFNLLTTTLGKSEPSAPPPTAIWPPWR